MHTTPDQFIETIASLKRAQQQAGHAFSHLTPDQYATAFAGHKAFISSVSWTSEITAGAWMYYTAWVTNPTDFWLGPAGLTSFFGPGQLATTPIQALEVRDRVWPLLESETFTVEPGKTTKVEIGHRVDHPVRAGARGVLNFLLWTDNNYDVPAVQHSRYHVRFRVAGEGSPGQIG